MPVLTYARKVLDKAKNFFEPPAQDIDIDLKKRFVHFQKLQENCDQVLATLKTKGWLIIEQVITDTIETNTETLKHTDFKRLEDLSKIQGNIDVLEKFLSVLDQIDTTREQAKAEIKALRK